MQRGPWMGLTNEVDPDVVVFGVPYDGSVSHDRGAALAPALLRELAADAPSWTEMGRDFGALRLRDLGDIEITQDDDERTQASIRSAVSTAPQGTVIVCLGGDHSITAGIVNGLRADGRLGLLWFDAHPDLMNTYRGLGGRRESRWNHACPLRRILETEKVADEDVFLVGIRDFLPEELHQIELRGLKALQASTLSQVGVEKLSGDIAEAFRGIDALYVSFDVDVLDPSCAPGTGVPTPGGLSMRYILDLFHQLIVRTEANRSYVPPIAGFDLVEISPPADINRITSRAGVSILVHALGLVAAQRGCLQSLRDAPIESDG